MIFHFENIQSYLKNYLKRLSNNGYGEASKIAAFLSVSSTYISHIFSGHTQAAVYL